RQGAIARSSRRGLCVEPAAQVQIAWRHQQMAAAARARSLRAATADRPAENGLRGADRYLAARSAARLGGGAAGAGAARGRWVCAHGAGPAGVAGALGRNAQLAISTVDGADAAGVARTMGMTPRPRRIVYITTDLRVGGAEAMLSRLASAQPRLADDITV